MAIKEAEKQYLSLPSRNLSFFSLHHHLFLSQHPYTTQQKILNSFIPIIHQYGLYRSWRLRAQSIPGSRSQCKLLGSRNDCWGIDQDSVSLLVKCKLHCHFSRRCSLMYLILVVREPLQQQNLPMLCGRWLMSLALETALNICSSIARPGISWQPPVSSSLKQISGWSCMLIHHCSW